MKKLLLAAVALMATMSVNAQQMFLKPMVGGTLSTITGDHSDDNKMKVAERYQLSLVIIPMTTR